MKAPTTTQRESYTLQIESELRSNIQEKDGTRLEVFTYIVSIMRVRDWCPQQEITVEWFFKPEIESSDIVEPMEPIRQEVSGYYEEYGFSKEDVLRYCKL